MWHIANCHCQAIKVRVKAPADIEAYECNCSMCLKTGFQHIIVGPDAFELLEGSDDLETYSFNTGVAKHYFCKHCGCRPFYVPRSNPDGFSVNARCLDGDTVRSLKLSPFDGQNWENHAAGLAHLSK